MTTLFQFQLDLEPTGRLKVSIKLQQGELVLKA